MICSLLLTCGLILGFISEVLKTTLTGEGLQLCYKKEKKKVIGGKEEKAGVEGTGTRPVGDIFIPQVPASTPPP